MRLINEDDVLEIIERVTNEAVEKKQPKYLIQPRIIAEIAGLPTIEAEPVKHGRWEYDHTIGGMKHYHCTNCKNSGNECIADENEILWWEFCPRCSARMDLKDGDSHDQTDR